MSAPKCRHCGKRYGLHSAGDDNWCPVVTLHGNNFSGTSSFEPRAAPMTRRKTVPVAAVLSLIEKWSKHARLAKGAMEIHWRMT